MFAILSLFRDLVFYLSLLRMLCNIFIFIYECCRELAILHLRKKLLTNRRISSTPMPSQNTTKKTNPYHKRISSEPISKNLISSLIVIDKYPQIELQPGKDKIQEISEEDSAYEESESQFWCQQCSCVLS